MRKRTFRTFVADFETTVYDGQEDTEVWAAAIVEMYTEDVHIYGSIGDLMDYMISLDCNICCYYHNLKFDGEFWLSYLLTQAGYKQASYMLDPDDCDTHHWIDVKDMPSKSVRYSISDMGQWYSLTIKVGKHVIELRDSLKLLPFSVKRIGKAFKTKHQKLEMGYKGLRWAGCHISEEEKAYIRNDVLVIKEALEHMYDDGHNKLTIGSCCLSEYRASIGRKAYKQLHPNIYDIPIPESIYGRDNAGDYVRGAYRGGWCYAVPGKTHKELYGGTTADVNSLYPSMMSSESNNYYPVGEPTFWSGDYIPDEAQATGKYYFLRLRTRFYLKPGKLPFIQVKNTLKYKSTEMLETSDIYNPKDGKYYNCYRDFDGTIKPADVTMTITMTDYQLMLEHYNLVDCEILDGCYFDTAIGIFDPYIDKYRKIKMVSTGARRELAKLFLNNLYGKMASNRESSYKYAYVKDDGSLGYCTVKRYDKIPGYIPIGAAITSYARNFTIRAAQANYHGPNERGFVYADTDSIHCDLPANEIKGIAVDPVKFCHWKLESTWDTGYFVRQKTYIEHVIEEDQKPCTPHYVVKCAGMPDKCKDLFIASMTGAALEPEKYSEDERKWSAEARELTDFDIGLKVPGKLMPKHIPGGVLLVETQYEMRAS